MSNQEKSAHERDKGSGGNANSKPGKEESKVKEGHSIANQELLTTPSNNNRQVIMNKNELNDKINEDEEVQNLFKQNEFNNGQRLPKPLDVANYNRQMQSQQKNGPQIVKLHALYQLNSDEIQAKSAIIQVIVHSIDMKSKESYDLEPEGVEFGQGGFKIYKSEIPLSQDFRQKFQLALLVEKTGFLRMTSSLETYNDVRKFIANPSVQFIFGLQFIKNNHPTSNIEIP